MYKRMRVFDAAIGLLLATSFILGQIAGIFAGMDMGSPSILFLIIAISLSVGACFEWVSKKNRNKAWSLFGLAAPIGWLVILFLKCRIPATIEATPQS